MKNFHKSLVIILLILNFNLKAMHLVKTNFKKLFLTQLSKNLPVSHIKRIPHINHLKKNFSTNNQNSESLPEFNELNYCANQTIRITLAEEKLNYPFYYEEFLFCLNQIDIDQLSEYTVVSVFGGCPERKSVLRSEIYFEKRLQYLSYITNNTVSLTGNFAKCLFYRAMQYQDYKMVIVLLKLGFDYNKNIVIKDHSYKLSDLFDNKIKLIIKLMKKD